MTEPKIAVSQGRSSHMRFDPTPTQVYDLISELNLRHQFLIGRRLDAPADHYMQLYLATDLSRYEIEYREGDPHTHRHADVDRGDDDAAHSTAADVFTGWTSGQDNWRRRLAWQPADRSWSCADRELRQADLTTCEGFGCDDLTLDGVTYTVVGVEDRATGDDLVRGHFVAPTRERSEVAVQLTHRAPGLPLDRAAELLRNTVFHHFTNHYYCQRIATLTVSDDAGSHTLPQDRC